MSLLPEVPPEANALSALFFVSVLVIGFYTIIRSLSKKYTYYERLLLSSTSPESISIFRYSKDKIAPRKKFRTIIKQSQVDVSVVTCLKNSGENAGLLIDKMVHYFNNSPIMEGKKYEIIVVDNGSNNKTTDIIYSKELQYTNVILMRLEKTLPPGQAIATGVLHARGKCIMHFFPFLAINISEFDKMYERLREMMKKNKKSVVVGVWPLNESVEPLLKTTFARFITWGTAKLYREFNIDGTALSNSHCFVYSRSAALSIFPNLYSYSVTFENEIICLAGLTSCSVDTVENELLYPPNLCMGSLDRFADFLTLIWFYILYQIGLHRIKVYKYTKSGK